MDMTREFPLVPGTLEHGGGARLTNLAACLVSSNHSGSYQPGGARRLWPWDGRGGSGTEALPEPNPDAVGSGGAPGGGQCAGGFVNHLRGALPFLAAQYGVGGDE